MKRRPKDIGTAGETAVVRYLQANGFPHAERRALRGGTDAGDITGCPGLAWEVKSGDAARDASDAQIAAWLAETERERVNAGADIGILVLQRRGVGPANAGRWWAVMNSDDVHGLVGSGGQIDCLKTPVVPIRVLLGDAVQLLRHAGYGDPPNEPPLLSIASATQAPATRCDDPDTSEQGELC